jgi:hypothetical protein
VEGSHTVRSDAHFDVVQLPYYGLKLCVIHAVQRFYHEQIILLGFVFFNRSLNRGKMLLVANIDVV